MSISMDVSPRWHQTASYTPQAQRAHCPQGHAYTPENTRLTKIGGRRCILCAREHERQRRARLSGLPKSPPRKFGGAVGNLTEDQIRRIAERLRSGETITQITRVDPVCCGATLQAFRNKHARLWKPLDKIAAANRYQRQVFLIGRNRRPASTIYREDNGLSAFAAITAATASLPDFLREDVRSLMFLAHAEGRLKPGDAAKRVREFVRAQNREFSAFVPVIGGRMQSLDQPVYDDGPTRLIDTVTQGLWG